jgi:DNA-3-methyladenine glycosylase
MLPGVGGNVRDVESVGSRERREAALLRRDFFSRPAQEVAPSLLGCVIESETSAGLVAVVIAEVEAYAGEADPASHAYHGPSSRNMVMFGPPGHAYVYFTYGMHFCMNVVCLPRGTASAVLLRGGAIVEGAELARQRRLTSRRGVRDQSDGLGGRGGLDGRSLPDRDLARGPARLCQALGVDRSLDGVDLCSPESPLRICAATAPPERIQRGPRVGVSTAASVPWRFWIAGEPTVSAYRAARAAPHKPLG